MEFNSISFLFFFSAVYVLYFSLNPKFRWILLLIASYAFYMFWNPYFILLIIFSTLADFLIAKKIYSLSSKVTKRFFLIVSLAVNLGLLGFFKYYYFASDSFNSLFSTIGLEIKFPYLNILLPVGISFYTFQTLSYTIDIYRGILKPQNHLGVFAVYVAFFPQLVAGPIERAVNLIPQLEKNDNRINYENFASGLTQTIFGLFKKVVVADNVALYVNSIYDNYAYHQGFTLVFATYLFAFQIYCDFSGYSDIAIGIARMLGYKFMTNFKTPYFSKCITEFWRRWHISLSTWLRDYLYFSLGGNRISKLFTLRNLMITMLLGGLWHGASWNFVIWGFLQGILLIFERVTGVSKWNLNRNYLVKLISAFATFNLVCITWIFFRSQTYDQSITIIRNIFSTTQFWNLQIQDTGILATSIFGIGILVILEFAFLRKQSMLLTCNKLANNQVQSLLVNSIIIITIILFGVSEGQQFIYFQF